MANIFTSDVSEEDIEEMFEDRHKDILEGLFIGDAIGAPYEFKSPEQASELLKNNVFGSGQLTDDSEMAICLYNACSKERGYDKELALKNYLEWYYSEPIDCGNTINNALNGVKNPESESNGALMRIAGMSKIFPYFSRTEIISWAEEDCRITHDSKLCLEANVLFALTIRYTMLRNADHLQIYDYMLNVCYELRFLHIFEILRKAKIENTTKFDGHIVNALHNAFYHLYWGHDLTRAIIETIQNGEDADTNASICSTLLSCSVFAKKGKLYDDWKDLVISAKPEDRPKKYWTSQYI